MNSYIDYDFYKNTFKGDLISEEKFNNFAIRATSKVRNRIFNRDISLFENEVKNATCSVAELLFNQSQNKERLKKILNGTEKQISSEKVGDYSRNITNISLADLEKFSSDEYVNNQIQKEIEENLFYSGLLYSGIPYE